MSSLHRDKEPPVRVCEPLERDEGASSPLTLGAAGARTTDTSRTPQPNSRPRPTEGPMRRLARSPNQAALCSRYELTRWTETAAARPSTGHQTSKRARTQPGLCKSAGQTGVAEIPAKLGRLRQKFYDYLIFSNATACGLRVLPLRHRVGVLVGRIRRFPHVSLRSAGSIEGAVCREELRGRQGANGHPRRRRIHATADPVLPTAFTATLALLDDNIAAPGVPDPSFALVLWPKQDEAWAALVHSRWPKQDEACAALVHSRWAFWRAVRTLPPPGMSCTCRPVPTPGRASRRSRISMPCSRHAPPGLRRSGPLIGSARWLRRSPTWRHCPSATWTVRPGGSQSRTPMPRPTCRVHCGVMARTLAGRTAAWTRSRWW